MVQISWSSYARGCDALVWPIQSFCAPSARCRTSLFGVLVKGGQAALVCDELVCDVVKRHGCCSVARESAVSQGYLKQDAMLRLWANKLERELGPLSQQLASGRRRRKRENRIDNRAHERICSTRKQGRALRQHNRTE